MKNLLLLLFVLCYSDVISAQCRADTTISGIKIDYVYKDEDSSVTLKIQFTNNEYGNEEFYYDPNECNFIPKIVYKLNDSTLIFLHGKGQSYRVVTVVSNRKRHVKIEKFENEIFYRNDKGSEQLFFMIDDRPFLINGSESNFRFGKYKKQISTINSSFLANMYKTNIKLVDKKGFTSVLKYSDFR
jgi:hypothetical protein